MRNLAAVSALVVLLLLSASPTRAQGIADKVEVYGGYNFTHIGDPVSISTNGWELAGEYKFAPFLGGVIDVDGTYGSGSSLHTVLFGPQVNFPARISPFGHFLIGVGHADLPFGLENTGFAFALGGGIDAELVPHIHWRVFQGDLVQTHLFGATENNARISTGIVIHF